MLDIVKLHSGSFSKGGESVPGSTLKAKDDLDSVAGMLTGTEMRGCNPGCRCTIVSYGHRRNNITFQHDVALIVAYRDAASYELSESVPFILTPRVQKMDLRDHGSITAWAHAHNSGGHREHLISTKRTIVRGHFV